MGGLSFVTSRKMISRWWCFHHYAEPSHSEEPYSVFRSYMQATKACRKPRGFSPQTRGENVDGRCKSLVKVAATIGLERILISVMDSCSKIRADDVSCVRSLLHMAQNSASWTLLWELLRHGSIGPTSEMKMSNFVMRSRDASKMPWKEFGKKRDTTRSDRDLDYHQSEGSGISTLTNSSSSNLKDEPCLRKSISGNKQMSQFILNSSWIDDQYIIWMTICGSATSWVRAESPKSWSLRVGML